MSRILLVEDNEMNRDMLRRRLAIRGYTVLLAGDGQEAIDVATRERPDLILMDLGLPVIDGWTASRQIRNGATTRTIPIIALTGHVMESEKDRALQAGCDLFVAKPIDLPLLIECMEKLLMGRSPATR